jgi:drug/metabolite transporter (DMT)-like permease
LPALGAACCWGIGYGLLGEAVTRLGWMAASLIQFTTISACCVIYLIGVLKLSDVSKRQVVSVACNPLIIGAAVTQQTGAVLLNIGLSGDPAGGSIIVALSACYPVLTAIIAFFLFDERISAIAMIGGLLAISGIVVLSIF